MKAGSSYEFELTGGDNLGTTDSIRVYDVDPKNDGGSGSAGYTNLVDFVGWGTSCPGQCDDSNDDAVKAGFWYAGERLDSNDAGDDISLKVQGNNDEGISDWDAKAVPEFGGVFLPVFGVVALFVVFRRKKRK